MAKQIKAIKCPQCGSVKKTCVKDDYYRCENCGTEYFLDNDDINVHVDHPIDRPQVDMARAIKIAVAGTAGIFVVFFFFFIVAMLTPSRHSGSGTHSASKPSNSYQEYGRKAPRLYLGPDRRAKIVYVAERRYMDRRADEPRNGYYLMFRDVETWEKVERYKLPIEVKNVDCRYFPTMKKLYMIINEQFLYEIHPETYTFEDVKDATFRSRPEFSSGVATLKFTYAEDEDLFIAVNNTGQEYYYFPAQDKLYTDNEHHKQKGYFDTLLPNAAPKTYYLFTEKSTYYPDEIIQLLGITYMYNGGGPSMGYPSTLSWEKKYSPDRKELFTSPQWYRYVSYKDLTPGRNYIEPKVLYFDDTYVLIRFKPTASPDAVPSVQLLDTQGNILWTQNGIYNVKWQSNNIVLIANGYLWMLVDDGWNRGTDKFLKIKLDGSDTEIIELPK